jgi:hypothetical protein
MIIEQSKYDEENVIEVEKDWKILTFKIVLAFRKNFSLFILK